VAIAFFICGHLWIYLSSTISPVVSARSVLDATPGAGVASKLNW
jgi:hypothetical protein